MPTTIDVTPKNLDTEWTEGAKRTELAVNSARKLIKEYAGRHHRSDREPDSPVPEPYHFTWIAQMTDRVVYDNPRYEISSGAAGQRSGDLKRLKFAMDRIAEVTDVWWTYLLCWYDTAFSFGVIRVSLEPVPGFIGDELGRRPHLPRAFRVPPHLYAQDPRSTNNPMEPLWAGHQSPVSIADLLADPDVDKGVVAQLSGGGGSDENLEVPADARGARDGLNRKQIWVREIWVRDHALPGYEDNPMFNGTIFTIATSDDGKGTVGENYLRQPRPYFGPREGPYELFGIYHVPDEVFALSPLAAIEEQIKDHNAHVDAAAKSADGYKEFIGVDPSVPETKKILRKIRHGEIATIPGLADGKVQQMSLGGAKDVQYKHIAFNRDNLRRSGGLDDAGMGLSPEEGTATGQATAAAARSDRIDFIAQMFRWHGARVARRQGWYAWHSEVVDVQLGPDAIPVLAPRPSYLPPENEAEMIALERGLDVEEVRDRLRWEPDLWLRRGARNGFPSITPGNSFDNAVIKFEAMSMERVSEPLLQKRKLEWLNIVAKVAPLIRQYPEVDWVTLLDQVGQSLNQKDAGDIINIELAHQLAGLSGLTPGSNPGTPGMAPMGAPTSGGGMRAGMGGIAGQLPGAQLPGGMTGALVGAASSAA